LSMTDPTLYTLAAVEKFWKSGTRKPILISSPPGLGKTALLSAVAATAGESKVRRIAWVSGSVIASDGHFAAVLANALDVSDPQDGGWEKRIHEIFQQIRDRDGERFVLILDDLDQLVFKRENLLVFLAAEFDRSANILLIGT